MTLTISVMELVNQIVKECFERAFRPADLNSPEARNDSDRGSLVRHVPSWGACPHKSNFKIP